MGLDMYLYAKRYLWSHGPEEQVSKQIAELVEQPNLKVKEVLAEAAYWRKANHIHNWFVQEVQNNEDDCGHYSVSREQLEELLHLCKSVKADKSLAESALPTKAGFFFGGTEYDEYYFEDIDSTITQLEAALALPDCWDFEYHSSW